jgi:DNA topoisomerase-1
MPPDPCFDPPDPKVEAQRHARANGLIYVSDTQPGIRRRRRGTSFTFIDADGKPLKDADTLARIRKLAIPPAYGDVWICPHERGHIQATGRDARGRKQYRYHADWRATRDDGKFSRMVEFGSRLPKLRRRLKKDLAFEGLPKDKVLAVVVTLLLETLIRIGNEEYARTNKSYGLTTLRDHHVKFLRDGRASFVFKGKSGRPHDIVLDDKRLSRIIRRCHNLPGQQLFQYVDDDGARQPIDSGMVNDYLRAAMCENGDEGFTAKDFRTWGATLRAIAYLALQECQDEISERAFKQCVAQTAQQVAEALGNTAAVCRKSYINPVVFDAWRTGVVSKVIGQAAHSPRALERLALTLLRSEARKARKPANLKALLAKSIGRAHSNRVRANRATARAATQHAA